MIRNLGLFLIAVTALAQAPAPAAGTGLKLVRSLSGPSGKLVGSQYVLDETRTRFVSPQDRALVIYFEWQAPAGDHAVTGIWKGPDGKVVHISPDIRMQTPNDELKAYWAFEIYPGLAGGIWTLEARVDGQPGGTHNFELVVPAQPAQSQTLSLNDIYRLSMRSVVWVRKIDRDGRRTDTSSGFVIGPDRVATAFQAVDGTDGIEVEFADGRVVKTDQFWAVARLEDWAILKVDTKDVPPLILDREAVVQVGERPIILNVEAGMARTLGGVDVSGFRKEPGFGDRIQISPSPAAETAGGPLIATSGKVVGMLGGSLIPGARYDRRSSEFAHSQYWPVTSLPSSAIPITLLRDANGPATLGELRSNGLLSQAIHPHVNFSGSSIGLMRGKAAPSLGVTEFTRRDTLVVLTQWTKKDKEGKGVMSAHIYDAAGRAVVNLQPKKMSLRTDTVSSADFSVALGNMPKGHYRIDLLWNDDVVYRTYATVSD